jgi:hypothetical protein
VDAACCWRTVRRREELPGGAVGREREAWPENDGVLFCFFGMYRWLNLVCVSVWEMGQEVVGPFVASSIPFCPFSFSFVGY